MFTTNIITDVIGKLLGHAVKIRPVTPNRPLPKRPPSAAQPPIVRPQARTKPARPPLPYKPKFLPPAHWTEEQIANTAWFCKQPEWKRARYDFLAWCRKRGKDRRCWACRAPFTSEMPVNVDHIYPRRDYPELCLDFNNMQLICPDCNEGKGNRHSDDWR